jgi:hypothetical protein
MWPSCDKDPLPKGGARTCARRECDRVAVVPLLGGIFGGIDTDFCEKS